MAVYHIDWQGGLIETGVTGILVPHGDVGELAAATNRLLGDRPLAAAMGRVLRKRALEMLVTDVLDEHERTQYALLLERGNRLVGHR